MIRVGAGAVFSGLRHLCAVGDFRRLLFPALSLMSLALVGCVTGSEMESTRSNVSQLQVQSVSRDREINQMRDQIASMSRELTTLTAIRESQTSLLNQVNDYSKELQSLRGRFDENKYFVDKTIKDLTSELELEKARTTALENELKAIKTGSAPAATAPAPAPANGTTKDAEGGAKTPAPDGDAVSKSPSSAAKLYDEAHISLKEKKYADARKKFERFVKDYPKESLTPNSYFWIGETYYSEKKYEDAILAYQDFLKKYPNNEKAKGAMLKQGFSFIELGDKKTGKVILESLIEKYPKSKEAESARKKLKDLAHSAPSSKSKKKK